MSDVITATVTLNKTTFNKGDSIVATLSGSDVSTSVATVVNAGPFAGQAVAPATGATASVTIPGFTINIPGTSTTLPIKWDTTVPVVDPSGRVWAFGADGVTLTAIA